MKCFSVLCVCVVMPLRGIDVPCIKHNFIDSFAALFKNKQIITVKVDMEAKAGQMGAIHAMCWKEINLLKMNMDKLILESERCQKLLLSEFISSGGGTNIFGLIIFDRYMSQMLTAMNMARKYNIHLEINDFGKTVVNGSYNTLFDENLAQRRLKKSIEIRNTYINDSANDEGIVACIEKARMIEHFNEVDESCFGRSNTKLLDKININVSKNVNSLLEVVLPAKNFHEFMPGFVFEAKIIHVRDYEKLEFFICLNDDHKTLYHLSRKANFNPIPCDYLPLDDVFCILENDGDGGKYLLRAIVDPVRYSRSKKIIYLVDFGEEICLTDKCKTYLAPLQYRQIPPLAIKCVLEGFEQFPSICIKDQQKCGQALHENEYRNQFFRLVYRNDMTLHVIMLTPKDNKNFTTTSYLEKTSSRISDVNTNISENSVLLQLPSSNILKMSKDPVLTAEIGDRLQVMVTHVVSPISFYGIIENGHNPKDKTFSWNESEILDQARILSPKHEDVVLSQYAKDGYWYRAKVIDIDLDKKMYGVFYVDFGNTEIVSLDRLAKCTVEQLKDPFRAVLFHLANLTLTSDQQSVLSADKPNLKSVIENLVLMTLDQIINVEVVDSRDGNLFVSLLDEQFAEIAKVLVDMGVAQEV